jgi:hypothetical protein
MFRFRVSSAQSPSTSNLRESVNLLGVAASVIAVVCIIAVYPTLGVVIYAAAMVGIFCGPILFAAVRGRYASESHRFDVEVFGQKCREYWTGKNFSRYDLLRILGFAFVYLLLRAMLPADLGGPNKGAKNRNAIAFSGASTAKFWKDTVVPMRQFAQQFLEDACDATNKIVETDTGNELSIFNEYYLGAIDRLDTGIRNIRGTPDETFDWRFRLDPNSVAKTDTELVDMFQRHAAKWQEFTEFLKRNAMKVSAELATRGVPKLTKEQKTDLFSSVFQQLMTGNTSNAEKKAMYDQIKAFEDAFREQDIETDAMQERLTQRYVGHDFPLPAYKDSGQ